MISVCLRYQSPQAYKMFYGLKTFLTSADLSIIFLSPSATKIQCSNNLAIKSLTQQ